MELARRGAAPPNVSRELTPFLKWAGGKRWLANRLLDAVQPSDGTYIEPFLGGGAVFFALRPTAALLSDTNEDLVNTYLALQSDAARVQRLLIEHHSRHSVEYFYQMREYRPRCEFRRAAKFIYLNRTCWNGLYRVNLKGHFNVPIGTKTAVLMDTDDWDQVERSLTGVALRCCDFEASIDAAKQGDVVFADPPYTVKHNLNGFIKYNQSLFSWSDQVRLRDALIRAKGRGARVVVTNANHASVRELYRGVFTLEEVTRSSVLAGSAKHRGKYEELLIRGD